MTAPDSGGTLSTSTFRAVAKALDEHGLPAATIFAASGLDQVTLRDDHARVPIALEHRVWTEIERRSGNPAIGLSVGESLARRGRHTVDLYLALNSGTPR